MGSLLLMGKGKMGLLEVSSWCGFGRFVLTTTSAAEELSEEDQQLKSELDMLVERLTVCLLSPGCSLLGANMIQGVGYNTL